MTLRNSGILLHPSSLPGPFGIGDLGPAAYGFVDCLRRSRQHIWQMLPLNPTRPDCGHSPYYCPSTFAGDPLLISPELLCRRGWLDPSECRAQGDMPVERIDFPAAWQHKQALLVRAADRFLADDTAPAMDAFMRRHRSWLDAYALFAVLDRKFGVESWCDWPSGLRDRDPAALAAAAAENAGAIVREKVLQFFFFQQWYAFRAYCRRHAVRLFGDLPIYVPFHSADVWAHGECFRLGSDRRPTHVSGVPPDYFSDTGQLWGHPVYDWERLRTDAYRWWLRRFALHMALFDFVRVDHFRGLVAYWQVPHPARTALGGTWVKAPGEELLALVLRRFGRLPLVAEDLGTIDAAVREVMGRFHLPGMRVLQFAFGEDFPDGAFLPHNHIRNCVVYTGTHDNNTVAGWYRNEAGAVQQRRFARYAGKKIGADSASWAMIRMAMQSVADTVIVPMQDVLGLGEEARMNHPARAEGNWRWRMGRDQMRTAPWERLARMTRLYGR